MRHQPLAQVAARRRIAAARRPRCDERRSLCAGFGPHRPLHGAGHQPARAVPRRAGGLHHRRAGPQRGAGHGRRQGHGVERLCRRRQQLAPTGAHQRRPLRQRPQLDFGRAGGRLGADRTGPSRPRSTAWSGPAIAKENSATGCRRATRSKSATLGDSWQTVANGDDRKSRYEHADKSDSDSATSVRTRACPRKSPSSLQRCVATPMRSRSS